MLLGLVSQILGFPRHLSQHVGGFVIARERLDRLVVWDQVGDFSAAEQAALAWTESLTTLDPKADLGPLRARLRAHFSDPEIGLLTATVAMINLWNRINISRH